MRALSWVVVAVGIWEVIAAFVLNISAAPVSFWNSIIVGILLIVLGGWATMAVNPRAARTLNWINAVLGLWLIVSPFVLGATALAGPLWSEVIGGILAVVFSAWAALASTTRTMV